MKPPKEERASCSVITRVGYKGDVIVQGAAYCISKCTKKLVCVVASIHLGKITTTEIDNIIESARSLVDQLCANVQLIAGRRRCEL